MELLIFFSIVLVVFLIMLYLTGCFCNHEFNGKLKYGDKWCIHTCKKCGYKKTTGPYYWD